MEDTIIEEPTGGMVIVQTRQRKYELSHDPRTGDWNVYSAQDEMVQSDWMKTKSDAIKFALQRGGIIEDADYTRAPNRIDA